MRALGGLARVFDFLGGHFENCATVGRTECQGDFSDKETREVLCRGSFPYTTRLKKRLYKTLPANPQHTKRLSNTTSLIDLEYIND